MCEIDNDTPGKRKHGKKGCIKVARVLMPLNATISSEKGIKILNRLPKPQIIVLPNCFFLSHDDVQKKGSHVI